MATTRDFYLISQNATAMPYEFVNAQAIAPETANINAAAQAQNNETGTQYVHHIQVTPVHKATATKTINVVEADL